MIDYEVKCPQTCEDCRHYISGVKCHAFAVIPPEIFGDAGAHDKVRDGQQGNYVFAPATAAETMRVYAPEV